MSKTQNIRLTLLPGQEKRLKTKGNSLKTRGDIGLLGHQAENASGSPSRKLLMLLGKGKFGASSWSCYPQDATPDQRLKIDG